MLFKLISMLALALIVAINSGCSVAMAASGKPDPNLSVIRVGASRGEVELQLGNPVASTHTPGGYRTDIYEYKIGAQASPGRAVAHGVMDVLTVGLWEVIGTPVEATQLGTKYRITLAYDENDRVLAVNAPVTGSPPASAPPPDSPDTTSP